MIAQGKFLLFFFFLEFVNFATSLHKDFGFSISSSSGWRGKREVAPALLVLQQLQSLDAVAARRARAQLRHRLPLQIQRGHRVGAIGRPWENRFYFKTNLSNSS